MVPNPAKDMVTEDGVKIPLGKGIDSKIKNSQLLYNEYCFKGKRHGI